MIKLQLTAHEASALLLLLMIGHATYNDRPPSIEVLSALDRIPTNHLDSLREKVATALERDTEDGC
jgi:hypothetical protein